LFLEIPAFLTAHGNTRLQIAHNHTLLCLTVTSRRNLLTVSRHRYSICSR